MHQAKSVNLEHLKELQVDETIDYSMNPFEKSVKDVDVVFDLVGGDTQLRPGRFGGSAASRNRKSP